MFNLESGSRILIKSCNNKTFFIASLLFTMEGFLGTWKFEKCEHFEEYLKALGISAPLRKLALLTSPTVTIRQSGGERSHLNMRERERDRERSENTL